MTAFNFDAYVTAALFDRGGQAMFALGDGTVRFEDGTLVQAHMDGAVLCATAHPSGDGMVTGGDDGRLMWSRPAGAVLLAEVKGRWIDTVASSEASGLIAFAAGRELHVRSAADPAFSRMFTHDKAVSGLSFDPKGLRIAASTYGGAALWYARIAEQKPTQLKWAGSHTGIVWSPDGRFVVSAMQDAQLHGWRLADGKDMRMGGYPAKIKSMAFLSNGLLLATAGAPGVVVWPFAGPGGPMGKEAIELAYDEHSLVARVAAAPGLGLLAGGREDGRVFALELRGKRVETIRAETGAPISALTVTADGRRLAWGDEEGAAGVIELPDLV
jgi:WD40 repeat protein